jgi:hypothetical protein
MSCLAMMDLLDVGSGRAASTRDKTIDTRKETSSARQHVRRCSYRQHQAACAGRRGPGTAAGRWKGRPLGQMEDLGGQPGCEADRSPVTSHPNPHALIWVPFGRWWIRCLPRLVDLKCLTALVR